MRFSFRVPLLVLCLLAPAAHAAAADAGANLARAVVASRDHGRRPFAVVDKQTATLSVYRADGRLVGKSAALIGAAVGDRSAPGVGERTQTGRLRPGDRTTAAGRFVSEPGRNLGGEPVVWIDYDNALAIHRLRAGPTHTLRAQRLASADAGKRRVSAGCVVVPVDFFKAVVEPTLGRGAAVVYVVPEDGDWQRLLDDADL
jgi:hypothetical protein